MASAETLDQVVQQLTAKSYNKKAEIVEAIALTGNAEAGPILTALLEGELYYTASDKKVVRAVKSGSEYNLTNPITSEVMGTAKKTEIKKIKINNKVRQTIKAALGGLDLNHREPSRRIAAAKAIFKSLDSSMLPILLRVNASEKNVEVQEAFALSIAALELLETKDKDIWSGALETVKDAGGPEAKVLLAKLLSKVPDTEENKEFRGAIEDSLKSVSRTLDNYALIENLFQGLSLGSVLLLAAIGLAITFGVMGVINMAHGEMVMIGAYTTYVIQEICRSFMPAGLEYSLIIAIPSAFIVAGMFGIVLEKTVIRFLYGRPLETLLATWGVSLILQQFVRTIFGPTNKEVSAPSWLSGTWEVASGLSFTFNRIAIILFALVVLFALMVVLKKTLFGLQMRAVTQNRQMARSMGVQSATVDSLTFGLGSGIAGMAGVALSQIDNVSPNLGQAYIIDSFMVVVFGGVGNLWGTLVGAGSLGIVNKFLEPYSGAVLAKIFVLVAIILFIQKRPRGLFALKGRSVEG
nr:urea ABC transporter permease subunit UrtB [Sneathiella sp. P13V-1]